MSFFCSCPCFFSDPFGKALERHFQEDKKIEQECEPELKPLPLHVTVGISKYGEVYRQHKIAEEFYAIPEGSSSLVASSRNKVQVAIVETTQR